MSVDCQNTVALAEIVVRGLLLSLVSLGGMLSIYLGWRLYTKALTSQTSGEVSWAKFRVKLSAASPGVFLAAFGAFLLYTTSTHRFEATSKQEQLVPMPSHGLPSDGDPLRPRRVLLQGLAPGERPTASARPGPLPGAVAAPAPGCQCLISRTTVETTVRRLGGSNEVTLEALQADVEAIRQGLRMVRLRPDASLEETVRQANAARSLDRIGLLIDTEAARAPR